MKPIIAIVVILIGFNGLAQQLIKPKKIRFKDNFDHEYSNTKFPKILENGFELTEIYAYDKKEKNIGATYERNAHPTGKITIYIYQAEDGTEDRLRNEYLTSMQSVANLTYNGLGANQYHVKYKGNAYDCNGFKADFKSENQENSSLSVYECGTWFFKLRLTTSEKDSLQIVNLENSVLEKFNLSHLTEQKRLNLKANVYFGKAAFKDSILLGSAMGSAYKKIEWVMENVPEKERASGFPGHYLDLQIASLHEFVAFEKKHNFKKSDYTQNYINQLNSLIESGYLDEFIMKQFSMVMIVPKEHEFDFDGFEKWQFKNDIEINLNELFYVIAFGQK